LNDIIVLGASGDIGLQCLDLLRYSFDYRLVGISLSSHFEKLEEYLLSFDSLLYVAIKEKEASERFIKKHPAFSHRVFTGEDCNLKLLKALKHATVFHSISGNDGLKPTLLALKQNQDLLLANKESIVIGYSLMKPLLKDYQGHIYPVDSEHVALYKLLKEAKGKKVTSCFITASGGALRDFKRKDLETVTPEMVLKHPTWQMSKKITIDSATMVNKGYEIIEANCLFQRNDVQAKICKSSLIHAGLTYQNEQGEEVSLVEYSPCDMHVSIAFSLSKGQLGMHKNSSDDLKEIAKIPLSEIDPDFYPCFTLTGKMFEKYSHFGMIYFNAVDCKAIEAFLDREITYLEIYQALFYTYQHLPTSETLTEENLDRILRDSDQYACSILADKPWR
jgi:1-deoxy-D-xylulose 5-phosphate reductoisomerase